MQRITETVTPPPPTTPIPTPDFISGERTRLRPVLEADLPALARLLAEAPLGFSWEREPWTHQRLKKKFEDEKDPGLWGATSKLLAITDADGALVGALRDERGRLGGCDFELHIAAARADRGQLGPDALTAFIAYKRSWANCPRLETALLDVQTAERQWLQGCGFELHVRCEEAWLHRGQLVALEIYAWLAPEVSANRAPDGIGQ